MLTSHDSAASAAEDAVRVRRALVSVFDKEGLVELGQALEALDVEIVSTGGTAKKLEAAGLPVTQIDRLTEFPEILDGRVKTLHPAVHGGILFQRLVGAHRAEVEKHGIRPIDLVIVNLYPFEEASRRAADLPELLEHIDIGGPAMARAAAKNFPYVTIVTDPSQYAPLLRELESSGGSVSGAMRARLAQATFAKLSSYDATVASALGARAGEAAATAPSGEAAPLTGTDDSLPASLRIAGELVQTLRYGENPHQRGALYAPGGTLTGVEVLQGKELSYNNLLDIEAVVRAIAELGAHGCAIIKHASPSGVAVGDSQRDTFEAARDADPLSAFGGIIGFAAPLTADTAEAIAAGFFEVVVAPGFEDGARQALARKKNLRLLDLSPALIDGALRGTEVRSLLGGFLLQDVDAVKSDGRRGASDEIASGTVASRRSPSDEERRALALAWTCTRLVRSNAIVLARADRSVGIGGGQASRIDALEVAAMKANRVGHDTAGTVLASDGFFPFRDCIDRAAELGVTAVVQPGGSKRDQESRDAADEHDIALIETGRRHFLH